MFLALHSSSSNQILLSCLDASSTLLNPEDRGRTAHLVGDNQQCITGRARRGRNKRQPLWPKVARSSRFDICGEVPVVRVVNKNGCRRNAYVEGHDPTYTLEAHEGVGAFADLAYDTTTPSGSGPLFEVG